MLDYLSTLPNFLLYLAISIALLAVFISVYVLVTPQHELPLIRHARG